MDIKAQLEVVKRNIKWHGKPYVFTEFEVDNYKELCNGKGDKPLNVKRTIETVGIYHQGSLPYINLTTGDMGSVQIKKPEYILCLAEGDNALIKQGDNVVVNGLEYNVNGVDDVAQLGIALEVNIEIVLEDV